MTSYPKEILHTVDDQINALKSRGIVITDETKAKDFLRKVNYYRFKGFLYQFYDNNTKQYTTGTQIETVINIYNFNSELSQIVFDALSRIEITVRANFIDAILDTGDPLSYVDSTLFKKENFWENLSIISKEISRSYDTCITHHLEKHCGMIPIWAATEVLSFGALARIINSLNNKSPAVQNICNKFATKYKYRQPNAVVVTPQMEVIGSWLSCAVLLRNICAHNSRLYNRSITKKPVILNMDKKSSTPKFYGIYEGLLAMKYLRSSDQDWNSFETALENLIVKYSKHISVLDLNFPTDWKTHLIV